jgi:hypothetical protein
MERRSRRATRPQARQEQAQKLARAGDSGTAILEVLKSDTVRVLKEQMANATRKAAELKTKYGPKHPEILKVNAEVAEAQAQIRDEIERLVANLKNEAEVAEGRERQLSHSLNQLKDQQVVTKDVGVELKDLEREAASSRQIFEALLTRYKQTAETQGFQLPDVRIIEKADAPQFPASPKRKQLVVMAGFGGLVLGLGLAILLELLAPASAATDVAAHSTSITCRRSLPNDGKPSFRVQGRAPRGCNRKAAMPTPSAMPAAAPIALHIGVPRIILVTSSVAGEGAEVIASNLAHNYALTGGRPLLIDLRFAALPLTANWRPRSRDYSIKSLIASQSRRQFCAMV